MPCALPNVGQGALVLRNRWQVSSLRDVFLSSHYWRLFEHLETPPQLVVDLGGHCGHFVVLCELLLEERFEKSAPRYVVVEGLGELADGMRETFAETGLASRCTVVHGLVGRRGGSGQLRSGASSLLDSSVVSGAGVKRGPEIPYVDLLAQLPADQPIDILKVDIEGSEHDLVAAYPDLLRRTRLCAMEVHEMGGPADGVLRALEAAGLEPCLPHIRKGPNLLVLYKAPKLP